MVLNESIKVKLTMEINNVADISSVTLSSDALMQGLKIERR